MTRLSEFHTKEDELFDPWEHLYDDEEETFVPIKPKVKKVKKMKKDKPLLDNKRNKRK